MALTNHQIENFLFKKLSKFKGVFSCDNIPQKIKEMREYSVIVNLSKSDEIGSHFITILKINSKEIWYIDSLGNWCHNQFIIDFMTSQNVEIFYNGKIIQSPSSELCGYFCIFVCLHFEKLKVAGPDFSTTDLRLNDELCIEGIKQLI